VNFSVSPHLLAVLWLAVVAVLMIVPADPLPELDSWLPQSLERWIDKIQHLAAFGVMTLLWTRSFADRESLEAPVAKAAGLTLAISFLLEALQILVPWRHFSVGDLVADTLGVVLALPVAHWISRRSDHPARPI
jgi:VanZ family protein